MKKAASFTIVFLILVSASCKKDRTCECTKTPTITNSTGGGVVISQGSVTAPSTTRTVYKKSRKSDMKALCGDSRYLSKQVIPVVNGVADTLTQIIETKCELK